MAVTFAGGTVAEGALVDTACGAEGFVAVGRSAEDVPGRTETLGAAIVLCLGRTAPGTEGALVDATGGAELFFAASWVTECVVCGTAAFITGRGAMGCLTTGGALGGTALDVDTTGVIDFEAGTV